MLGRLLTDGVLSLNHLFSLYPICHQGSLLMGESAEALPDGKREQVTKHPSSKDADSLLSRRSLERVPGQKFHFLIS